METQGKAKTYAEQLQDQADEYFATTGKETATTQEIAEWAMRTERWFPPSDLALRLCKLDFRRALSQQRLKDAAGNPVRAKLAAKVRQGERQLYLWGDTRKVSRKHLVASMQMHRDQMVGGALLISRTEKFWNGLHPDEEPVQTLLDFRDDVAEAEFSGEYPKKKPAEQPAEQRTEAFKPK